MALGSEWAQASGQESDPEPEVVMDPVLEQESARAWGLASEWGRFRESLWEAGLAGDPASVSAADRRL